MNSETKKYNRIIALYFMEKPLYFDDERKENPNIRKLIEQIWQQAESQMSSSFLSTITSFEYVSTKILSVGPQKILTDFELIYLPNLKINKTDINSLELIRDAIRLSIQTIINDPIQLYSQIYGRLLSFDIPLLKRLCKEIKRVTPYPRILPLSSSLERPGFSIEYSIKISPQNKLVIFDEGRKACSSSINDNTIIIWDLQKGVEVRRLVGHKAPVKSISMFPDGKKLISASDDKTLIVWDIEEAKILNTLKGHKYHVESVALYNDGKCAISSSADGYIRLWDTKTGDELGLLKENKKGVNVVAVDNNGNRAVSASWDETIIVWDLKNANVICKYENTGTINDIKIFANGSRAIVVSNDKSIKILDIENGTILKTLEGHNEPVLTVAVFNDGKMAISGSADKTFKIWDIEKGLEVESMRVHTSDIVSLGLFPNEINAFSFSNDGLLRVLNLKSHFANKYIAHNGSIDLLYQFSDGEKVIIVSCKDTSVKIWDIVNDEEILGLKDESLKLAKEIFVNENETRSGIILSYGAIKVYDLNTLTEVKALGNYEDNVFQNCLSDITLQKFNTLWDIISFDFGSKIIFTAWEFFPLCFLDLKSDNVLQFLCNHKNRIWKIAVSSNEQWAVSLDDKNFVSIWDLKNKKLINSFYICDESKPLYGSIAIFSEKEQIITTYNNIIEIRNYREEGILVTLNGHNWIINKIILFKDEKHILTISNDHTIKIWDLVKCRNILTFTADYSIKTCSMSEKDETIIAGDENGFLHILKFDLSIN